MDDAVVVIVTLLLAVVVGDTVGVALGLAMATSMPVLAPMYTEPSAPIAGEPTQQQQNSNTKYGIVIIVQVLQNSKNHSTNG